MTRGRMRGASGVVELTFVGAVFLNASPPDGHVCNFRGAL